MFVLVSDFRHFCFSCPYQIFRSISIIENLSIIYSEYHQRHRLEQKSPRDDIDIFFKEINALHMPIHK